MKIVKKVVIVIISVIIIAILLDFIPVKFAVKLDDAKKNLKDGRYICETNPVTLDIGWYADMKLNQNLDDDLCVRALGDSPNNFLSEKTFDFKWYELYNIFLLVGKAEHFVEDKKTNNISVDLDVKKWDIIYPIKRASFRQYYAPKGYLTVYDYDWLKLIKSLWK